MHQDQIDWFERWFGSPYYHILYTHRDHTEAQIFVQHLLQYLKPAKGSKMLDIACGEGRHSIQLAEQGFEVIGLDISAASISKAKSFANENATFYVHDMRYAFYINYFDFSFNFFTSFGYFNSFKDHLLAAQSFANGLKKGGKLVIDYINMLPAIEKMVANEIIDRPTMQFRIERKMEDKHFLKNIYFTDANGLERAYSERVAAFSLDEFIDLFHHVGLEFESVFGDYHLGNYDAKISPRMIMIFKK